MYRTLRSDLDGLGLDGRELQFQSARAAYYMARGYQAFDTVEKVLAQDGDMRAGRFKVMQKSYTNLPDIIALYEESMSLSELYLKSGRDARGVRLNAESLSQLSTLKTLGFLMSNGTKIQPLAEEAVSLDSGEVKAHLLLASRYVYSPGIWGGDPDKGIAMLEDISRMGGTDKEDRHNISVGMGFAHTMAKRWDAALPFFHRALEIYPGNIYAAAMVELCERNRP
jgi:tetratricopeptide (TPR) repeat protein